MRTAFLILAHDEPAHLGHLARSLRHPQARTFVHIDARSGSLAPFRAELPDGAELLTGRRAVRWGGRSVLLATLDLLRTATTWQADRYVLLSGSDVLARPLSALFAELAGERQFLRIDRSLTGGTHSQHVDRLYFNDSAHSVLRKVNGLIPRLRRSRREWLQGSQWWALTDACVRDVLARFEAEPALLNFLRHAGCPDEIGIATLVAHGPFAAAVTQDYRSGEPGPRAGRYGLHYIDWGTPVSVSPEVLDDDDLEAIVSSDAFFARKVRSPRSDLLVRTLAARTEEPRYAH